MSDITELETRITKALDRIGAGITELTAAASGDAELEKELAAEREANAQLEERVRAIREKQETTLAALRDEVAGLKDALQSTDTDLQRVKAINAELRNTNAALREANASGLADAALVNSSLSTELDALRILRETDRAEIDRVLSELDPILGEAANA